MNLPKTELTEDNNPIRCVICNSYCDDSGLCDEHKYDEQKTELTNDNHINDEPYSKKDTDNRISSLTNEKINIRKWLKDNGWLWNESHLVTPECMNQLELHLATIIHQAEIKARLDELVKLKKAHSIAIFDEYLENHISALEKEIV